MSEIEKQFFETFEIEPRYEDACTVEDKYWANEELANEYGTFDQYMNCKCGNQENCTTECSCAYQKEIYPQITDHILLKLLSIQSYEKSYYMLSPFDSIDELKKDLLNEFIDGYTYDLYNDREDVKHQVRTLFKENN